MRVIAISKTSFNIVDHNDVTNITYSAGSVTITVSGGSTATYSLDNVMIQIVP